MMARKHRLRALRNALMAGLLLLFLWYSGGCPLPTLEMELHRMERRELVTPAPVVWQYRGTMSGDSDMAVSAGYGHVAFRSSNTSGSAILPLKQEGATLVALPGRTRHFEKGGSYLDPAFLAVNPPAGAERAVLELTVTCGDENGNERLKIRYSIEGERQGEVFFFQMVPQYRNDMSMAASRSKESWEYGELIWLPSSFNQFPDSYPHTLTFYDAEGNIC